MIVIPLIRHTNHEKNRVEPVITRCITSVTSVVGPSSFPASRPSLRHKVADAVGLSVKLRRFGGRWEFCRGQRNPADRPSPEGLMTRS